MDMSVMEAIQRMQNRLDLSDEKFAHLAGVSVSTYSRQKHGKQVLGGKTIEGYAKVARQSNDTEVLQLIAAFVTGLDPSQISIKVQGGSSNR